MSIVPNRVQDLLDFADAHAPVFQGAHAQIGITTGQATKFAQAAEKARQQYNDAIAANNAKRAATSTSQASIGDLRKTAADTIALIKAFAENQADPTTVYDTAQLPTPQPPSPVGPPGTPSTFTIGLRGDGALLLAWRCTNPSNAFGTIYEVRRRTGANTNPFEFLGANGQKKFTDQTLAAGSTSVVYEITAVRSTVRGMPAQFNVNFGIGAGGVPFAMVTPMTSQSVKMAA